MTTGHPGDQSQKENDVEKLKGIEFQLNELVEDEVHIIRSKPNRMPFLMLELCQEVIRLLEKLNENH